MNCVAKYFRITCKAICLTAKALGDATDNDPKHSSKSTLNAPKVSNSESQNSIKLLLLKVDAQATESSGVFSFLTGLYFYILSLVILRASVNCSMLILCEPISIDFLCRVLTEMLFLLSQLRIEGIKNISSEL